MANHGRHTLEEWTPIKPLKIAAVMMFVGIGILIYVVAQRPPPLNAQGLEYRIVNPVPEQFQVGPDDNPTGPAIHAKLTVIGQDWEAFTWLLKQDVQIHGGLLLTDWQNPRPRRLRMLVRQDYYDQELAPLLDPDAKQFTYRDWHKRATQSRRFSGTPPTGEVVELDLKLDSVQSNLNWFNRWVHIYLGATIMFAAATPLGMLALMVMKRILTTKYENQDTYPGYNQRR